MAVLPQERKEFPYRPTRDVSLLSGHASYFVRYFGKRGARRRLHVEQLHDP